jgi:M6 family metalloprotease-like protein
MKYTKYFLTFFLAFFTLFTTYGAYLKNVPQKLTQPDGTVIHCFATGDEFYNWLHDSLGYTIVQDSLTGYYVYAVESEGDLLPTSYIVGKANPVVVGLKKGVNISLEKILTIRKQKEELLPQKPVQKAGTTNHGHINNLVFFIRFSDENGFDYDSYNELVAKHNDLSLGDMTNSMSNFYKLSSYGKFSVTTTFYPSSNSDVIYSYQDIYPRNFYLQQSAANPEGYSGENDRKDREHELLRRVVAFFKDSVPTDLNLDFNNDGKIDNICFITSGSPEGWSGLMWPHRWSLSDPAVYINGKQVYDYNFIMENYTSIGVLTHEFMHTLGAPDLYVYNDDYDYLNPVGSWDLMASTNYPKPQGLGAYMKYKYGNWIESIPEITFPGTYTLYPANGTSPDKTAYILRPEQGSSQYLLFEYRKTTSNIFEESVPNSGLLIYRINDAFEGNANYDNKNIFNEVYIFRPNGTQTTNGNISNATFASDYNRTSFNLSTNPYPFYSEKDSYMSGINITDITELGDSIQFTVREVIDSLDVSANEFALDCASGSDTTFTISSNEAWIITGTYVWLSVSTKRGKGNQTITLKSLSANETETDRVATLNITTNSSYNPATQRVIVRHKSCNSSTIEHLDLSKNIILTPNPVSDILTVQYQQIGDFNNNDIAVYSMQGQKLSIPVSHLQENQLQLNVQTLASGIYYLKIQTSKGSVVKAFSVN